MNHKTLTILIGLVWLINGLVCKVIGLVPRHEEIVATILGATYAKPMTLLIGFGEIGIALWIWSGYQRKLVTWVQVFLVATMNVLEFLLVPELLLWGRWNSLFALLFIGLVVYHGFVLRENRTPDATL